MTVKLLVYVAGALLLALLGASARVWLLTAERDALVVTNSSLTAERGALNDDVAACKTANTGWRGVVGVVNKSLLQCVGDRHDINGRVAVAVAASRKAEARLAAEYNEWRARFRIAAKTPDCASALETKLCPAVLDY